MSTDNLVMSIPEFARACSISRGLAYDLARHDEWHFSIVDVVAAITDSGSPSRYWTQLRDKLNKENGGQLFDKIEKLKMPGVDGKEYMTDAANTITVV